METCGLLLAFPVAMAASIVYALLVRFLFSRSSAWSRLLVAGSAIVLALGAFELIAFAVKGIVGARAALGPSLVVLHDAVFVLAPPAVANVLALSRRPRLAWPVVAVITFAVAIAMIFFNVHVSEALYGVDGVGGPYGERVRG